MLARDLNWIPNSSSRKQQMLDGLTGRLLHEIGHTVAAAKQGYPTDLIILDERSGASLDCAYMHESFWPSLENSKTAHCAILAGGFMAEYNLFSEVAVNRAISDLEALCGQRRMSINKNDQSALISTAKHYINHYKNLFDNNDIKVIKKIYARSAEVIRTGEAMKNNAFIITCDVWADLTHGSSHTAEVAALQRTTQGNYPLDALETLRKHHGKSEV